MGTQTRQWQKKDIITDEVKAFIMKCLDSDRKAPRKQQHTAHKIYTRLIAECGFEGCEGCEGDRKSTRLNSSHPK